MSRVFRLWVFMSHWVYALYSIAHDKLYVGETGDLHARFLSHNELATKGWTVRYRPWIILYSEEVASRSAALVREKQLKSGGGRTFLRGLLAAYYNK
ncbi:MAG: GIY-YIG nuclease family protein [Flavobacteriales bacterium]|nr:GIY-YIG nuclease family protein [Flavobacteriales bacterium]